MSGAVEIRRAADSRSRRSFLDLPYRLYDRDPLWVPPLRGSQAKLFAAKTAFFAHAEMALFLALRGGVPVARIAAIHNKAHNVYRGDKVGFFGFFECADGDRDAAAALLSAAEEWLGARGLDTVRGPMNPSMNAECGFLIQGFDRPPMPMMPHNPRSYSGLVEAAGYRKCKDLYAYWTDSADFPPGSDKYDRMARLAAAMMRRHPELAVRPLNMAGYREDIVRFMGVFEEARRKNWGYVPMTREEILETAGEMKMIADPEVVIFAEVAGEPAGAAIAIPNFNPALRKIRGRLLPFGFITLLREMKRVHEARVLGIAALEKYRNTGVASVLFYEIVTRCIRRGYPRGEASWVLEDNVRSTRTIEDAIAVERYKTYRIYEKPIVP